MTHSQANVLFVYFIQTPFGFKVVVQCMKKDLDKYICYKASLTEDTLLTLYQLS